MCGLFRSLPAWLPVARSRRRNSIRHMGQMPETDMSRLSEAELKCLFAQELGLRQREIDKARRSIHRLAGE